MDMSIIVPCHNIENYITPLLVSLKLQELADKEVEIIFVCDDCTDGTEAKITSFCHSDRYAELSLLKCKVHSCGLARNIGLEEAKGEYIWFVDGDDWLTTPYAILHIFNYFKETGALIIRFDYEAPDYFLAKGHPSMVWQYAYRRDLIGDLRFTEIQPHEDLEFNRSIMHKLDNNFPFLNRKLYYYNYMREGSNIQQLLTKGKIEP